MKFLSTLALGLSLSTSAFAGDLEKTFKAGDHLEIQTVQQLSGMGASLPVTIVETGAKSWVLVEYDRTFAKAGESGLKTEKAQMWVNFDHVLVAKKTAAK